MKSDALFQDLKKHSNIKIFENIDKSIKESFRIKFNNFQDKLFFEVIENCGGIIIDNWIRLYGCGELNVISKYLPQPATQEEIEQTVINTIEELNATQKDFGKVMKEVTAKLKNRTDGKTISGIVKQKLN